MTHPLRPSLLLVGGRGDRMNRAAYEQMVASRYLDIIAGATHHFEESGALDTVALSPGEWFTERITPARRAPR